MLKKFVAIRDAMELLSGKWKIHIISVLMYKSKLRFMDLTREINGIAAKMLSKELQDLELNDLVKRTVCNTKPVTVEYEITEYGKSLEKVVGSIMEWGRNIGIGFLVKISVGLPVCAWRFRHCCN